MYVGVVVTTVAVVVIAAAVAVDIVGVTAEIDAAA